MKTGKRAAGEALLRFYEELNEYLPQERRKKQFAYTFGARMTIRGLLRRLRVPVSAVDLVLVNGDSVGLSHVVRDKDRLSFYPVFEAFDIAPVQRIRLRPLRRVRFAVDPALKPLASGLRGLGFDAVLAPEADSSTLAGMLAKEGRIFVTRSARKIGRGITHALCIRSLTLKRQLAEVQDRLHLPVR